jgi:hypothetical protein
MSRIFWRLLALAFFLYFVIAAYGCYSRLQPAAEPYVCPCDQCDCGPPIDQQPDKQEPTP